MYIALLDFLDFYKMGRWRDMIQSTGLTPPHVCACSNPEAGFLMTTVVVFCMLNSLRWEVIGRFADIGVIVVHHYLHFLFKH
jgi:hypothetical protein